MNKLHRPRTHRDRTKYDRYEDYLKDQLDDMVDDLDADEPMSAEEFKTILAGEEYDPDGKINWDKYQYEQYEEDENRELDELAANIRDTIDKEIVDDMSDYINYDD